MKRLIAALVIAVLLFTTAFTGIKIISTTASEVENRIKKIQATAFEKKTKNAESFFYFWEERRELMAVFVNHEAIDEIGRLAAKMVSAERAEEGAQLFESANEILFIVRGLKEDEQFSLYTLL